MTLSPIDLVILILMVFMTVRVTLSGFIAEFFSKAAVIAGVILAVLFHRSLAELLEPLTGAEMLTGVVAFLVIFLMVYLCFKIAQGIVGSAFEGESLSNLDRALGFFLGLAEGLLLAMALIAALRLQYWFDPSPLLDRSVFARLFDPLLARGLQTIPVIVPAGPRISL